jgi:hypothetical protein
VVNLKTIYNGWDYEMEGFCRMIKAVNEGRIVVQFIDALSKRTLVDVSLRVKGDYSATFALSYRGSTCEMTESERNAFLTRCKSVVLPYFDAFVNRYQNHPSVRLHILVNGARIHVKNEFNEQVSEYDQIGSHF